MAPELRGYELDMYEWLKKNAQESAPVFAEIMRQCDEPSPAGDTYVAAVLDDASPDKSADVHPIDFFREFRDGILGELDDSIRDLSRDDLAVLVRLVALRYACQIYRGDERCGRNLLFFNAFHKVYAELHSDSAVRRREALAVDGWHNRICVIYPDDKNPQALLNAYRQGQNAKRDGRECGCAACAEEARRTLEARIGDPEPAFSSADDAMPF